MNFQVVSTIIITVVTTFLLTLLSPEITQLNNLIREKPFETFVVLGLCFTVILLM